MSENLPPIAGDRLQRARDALRDGALLLAEGSLIGATNRLYYAAFYAARACLAMHEVDAKRHSGVIKLFQERFVASGLIAHDTAAVLARAFGQRQRSDYGDFTAPAPEGVEALHEAVKRFVDACADVAARLASAADK